MITQAFTVEVPGGRIHGDQVGTGPAVVLLHAGLADRRMWNQVAAGLGTASFRVIRFDARGYGESPPSSEPYHPAADVIAVLDHLQVERAHLVGASMGGHTAMDVAIAYPQRVTSLALLASGLPGFEFGDQLRTYWRAEAAALDSGDIDAVIDINLSFWVYGPDRPWTPRLGAVAQELRDQLRIIAENQATGEDLEQAADPLARDALGSIAVPTLVVAAGQDADDFVRASEVIAAGIPGARLQRMADAGHLLALEHPEETLDLLRAHLAGA